MKCAPTTKPIEPGNFSGQEPEFGRQRDVQFKYGLKRGTLYNLLADGKVKGVLLRVRGQKSGVRLFDMASVRAYVLQQMAEQNSASLSSNPGNPDPGQPPAGATGASYRKFNGKGDR